MQTPTIDCTKYQQRSRSSASNVSAMVVRHRRPDVPDIGGTINTD